MVKKVSIIYLYFKKDKISKNYSDPDASILGGSSSNPKDYSGVLMLNT
jgi:hypothetical protein